MIELVDRDEAHAARFAAEAGLRAGTRLKPLACSVTRGDGFGGDLDAAGGGFEIQLVLALKVAVR